MAIANYLHTYGDKDVAGIVLVDAVVGFKPGLLYTNEGLAALAADDLSERGDGIAKFLRACFNKQPDEKGFELMLTYNAMLPVIAQRAIPNITLEGVKKH